DKLFNCLKNLKHERVKILVYIADAEDESGDMLERMESERQKRVADFRTLHQLLNEQEKDHLALIEEIEKEIARKREEHLARLSEELSSLESLIREMEEKHQQPANELLQDVRGTLQRCEEKETFENPEVFPSELKWKLWNCCDNDFLECAIKQFKDTLNWAFPKLRAKVTLDPASASSHLFVAGQYMRWQSTAEDLPEDPEKCCAFVLGCEGFTAGCRFWEVRVEFGEDWAMGVARKPVEGRVTLTPEEGIWAVERWKGQYKAFVKGTDPPLTLRGEPTVIRVCLDYDGGRVAFFDAERATLLYEFSSASFSGETLYPFFGTYSDCHLWIHP
ncbi:UNVERIFIED_CONTAM: hypothetical protein K2H54_061126, partial [Gekko kuhli]